MRRTLTSSAWARLAATRFVTEGERWKAREERGKVFPRAFLNMKGVEEEEGNRVSIIF